MQVFLAGALGLLGIVLIVAGAKGNGPKLLTAVTGVAVFDPAAATSGGGAKATPAVALGPTGPGSTGAVISV